MIKYNKLWATLALKGMKKTDLYDVPISTPTLARLGKNESVNTEIIDRICAFLNLQPGDIMEYFPDEKA